MVDKSKLKESDLDQRKKKLKSELDQLQDVLGETLSSVRDDVREKANIWYWIKKYPTSALAATLLIGFLAGKKNLKSKNSGLLLSSLMDELKKAATRKAVQTIVQQLEDDSDKS